MTLTRSPRGGRAAGLVVALTTTVLLAACSSTGAGAGDSSGDGEAAVAESSQPSRSLDESAPDSAGSGVGTDTDAAAPVSAPRAPAIERHVISQGTVSLISDDVAQARRDVQRIVDARQGTITEEETTTDDDGDATYSRMVVRIPSSSFGETVLELEQVAELRTSQTTSEDVTTEVIDTEVRVRAQESSLRRVEQLLARARSLKDIVWIESQLTQRQSELDSLKSRRAWLADQTSDSTITIDVEREQPEEAAGEKQEAGFLVGLTGGMKALGAAASAIATIAGALLPFVLVLVVLGAPMWLLVRRNARRRRPARA